MNHFPERRIFLLAAASLPLAAIWPFRKASGDDDLSFEARFEQIEERLQGRLGLFAIDTGDGKQLGYRADERFPMCSTFKMLLASAVLQRSMREADLMRRHIGYGREELVAHSPVTEEHAGEGMTVGDLCAAAIQYSDNTATNLLIRMLGGPAAVTAFARSIGDAEFRLDRWEPDLNTAEPGDPRDTSTPRAMGSSLWRLALGEALGRSQRRQLQDWLCGNTTGAMRIQAAIPPDWRIGDKTGSGDYGTANDIAVLWPPHRAPVVMAIYTTRHDKTAAPRSDIVASAARVAVHWLDR